MGLQRAAASTKMRTSSWARPNKQRSRAHSLKRLRSVTSSFFQFRRGVIGAAALLLAQRGVLLLELLEALQSVLAM